MVVVGTSWEESVTKKEGIQTREKPKNQRTQRTPQFLLAQDVLLMDPNEDTVSTADARVSRPGHIEAKL